MRGDEWNQLVAEPTATDVEAALADVKLRAMPIARRSARKRQAAAVLGLIVFGAGSALGGRMSAGPTLVPSMGELRDLGATKLTTIPGGYGPVRGALRRWHISAWDEMAGVRFSEGDAWVEGPEVAQFSLSRGSATVWFRGNVWSRTSGDSTLLLLNGTLTQHLGETRRGVTLEEQRWIGQVRANLVGGQSALFYPFGTSGETVTVIRIDGPFAPPAPAGIHWRAPDTLNVSYPAEVRDRVRAAAMGVRVASRNASSLFVEPNVGRLPLALRR